MKTNRMVTIAIVGNLITSATFAQDDSIGIVLGPVTAIAPIQEKARQDGNKNTLDIIVRGLASNVPAHFSNNDSPFAIIGGDLGGNLYKKIFVDEKWDADDLGQDNVKYGMTIEVTFFNDVTLDTSKSGINSWTRTVSVSATIHIHDVGKMRGVIAVPDLNAETNVTLRVRSRGEAKQLEGYTANMIRDVQQNLAKQLTEKLLEAYYKFPGYVIKSDAGVVTVDQGEVWAKAGDTLTVYGPPEETTKNSRGRLTTTKSIIVPGPRLGTLTVTEAFPDTLHCKVDGTFEVPVESVVQNQ